MPAYLHCGAYLHSRVEQARIQKNFQRGSNFDNVFFLVDDGREDPNNIGADGAPILNAGFVALWFYRGSGSVLLRNPIFCDFQGGGVRTTCPPPPFWIRTCRMEQKPS